MKYNKILVGVLIGASVVLILFSFKFGFDRGKEKATHGYLVKVDSLLHIVDSVRSLPPIVVIDTVVVPPDTVVKWNTKVVEVPFNPERHLYSDSIYMDELALYIIDSIEGRITHRDVGVELFVPKEVEITKEITKEVPVVVKSIEYIERNAITFGGEVGGGSSFAYSITGGYIFDQHQLGLEYMRFGGTNNWMLSYNYLFSIK
jgi:hypothetical protein